jgi:predicted transcriptional regulator
MGLPARREYNTNILVPTSVHIPAPLLQAVDSHAKRLGVSRNRVIVGALERELARETAWSPGFFEALSPLARGDAEALDGMLATIRARRSSKAAPRL